MGGVLVWVLTTLFVITTIEKCLYLLNVLTFPGYDVVPVVCMCLPFNRILFTLAKPNKSI